MAGMRLIKGAFVALGHSRGALSVIVFQYNPDKLHRALTSEPAGAASVDTPRPERGGSATVRQSMSFTLQLDARDPENEPSGVSGAGLDILPALSAIEELIGRHDVLLVWGPRLVPVALTNLAITETAFDVDLAPVQATVEVTLQTLDSGRLGGRKTVRELVRRHAKQIEAVSTKQERNVAAALDHIRQVLEAREED